MRTNRFALVMLAGCAVTLCAPAHPVKAEGVLTLGNQWWTQTVPEAKFQEFREVVRGPFLESLVLDDWSGRNAYSLSARNGFQKDQTWRGMWAWGSKLNVKFGYVETPHRFSFNARSPYTEVLPGVFVLPDSLQALNRRVTSGNSIPNALQDALNASRVFPLEFSTDVTSARVRVRPKRGWMFEANGRQATRSGRKAYSAIIGTSPGNPTVELWEPIDQTTTDADVRANYSGARVTVQAVGGLSVFNNHLDRMTWDNTRALYDTHIPWSNPAAHPPGTDSTTIPGRGQLALPPDNNQVRGSVAVGVRMPKQTLFSGTVGFARTTQDQAWLPVTINSALRPDTLVMPGTNTDGKADVLNLDGRLTTMAVEHFRGTLRFHSDKYDNKTPERTFAKIVTGDLAQAGPFETKPFGNSNWVAGLDVDANPTSSVSVGATGELRTRERTHREVEKDKETVFALRAKLRPRDGVVFEAKGRFGNRELDEFIIADYQNTAGAFIEQPTLRRPDVANRKQTLGSAGLSWTATEKLDLSATYSYLKNDYQDLDYGLTKDQSDVISSLGTLHATERLDLRAGYGYSLTKTSQRSIQSRPNTPPPGGVADTGPGRDTLAWTADLDDKNVFVSAGFDVWVKPEKFSIVGDYEFSRDQVRIDLTAGPAFTSPFVSASNRFTGDVPSTFYRRHDAVLELRYQLLASTQITGRYAWEQFDVDDFAVENVPQVAAGAASLYLGDLYRDYHAHRMALLVKHTF